ncbi:TetR family transcriptional regulator [Kitasatospora sp. NPDC097605]|uniref:TetR/AcrR family transcriptional regulator n=1 Tax=Kitasatospora sp. NPDC097605 TaxID=3157226 RepID=UPI0033285DA2
MATDSALTTEQILAATEDVLRRFGPTKATVVDVARTLGVSHGSVYRFFPSKAALREAVTQRWLAQAHDDLRFIAIEPGPAAERLHRWLTTLFAAKRRKALDDPQLFATYMTLVGEASHVVDAHLQTLIDQIAQIVQDGIEKGDFRHTPIVSTSRAVFEATAHFHDPAHATGWSDPAAEDRFEAVWKLVLRGLAADA